jgi:hypothetical protein
MLSRCPYPAFTDVEGRSWDAVRQEVEMKRIVAVVLVAAGLIGGTWIRPLAVRAQPTDFPFNAGDAVTIEYSTQQVCHIFASSIASTDRS